MSKPETKAEMAVVIAEFTRDLAANLSEEERQELARDIQRRIEQKETFEMTVEFSVDATTHYEALQILKQELTKIQLPAVVYDEEYIVQEHEDNEYNEDFEA